MSVLVGIIVALGVVFCVKKVYAVWQDHVVDEAIRKSMVPSAPSAPAVSYDDEEKPTSDVGEGMGM